MNKSLHILRTFLFYSIGISLFLFPILIWTGFPSIFHFISTFLSGQILGEFIIIGCIALFFSFKLYKTSYILIKVIIGELLLLSLFWGLDFRIDNILWGGIFLFLGTLYFSIGHENQYKEGFKVFILYMFSCALFIGSPFIYGEILYWWNNDKDTSEFSIIIPRVQYTNTSYLPGTAGGRDCRHHSTDKQVGFEFSRGHHWRLGETFYILVYSDRENCFPYFDSNFIKRYDENWALWRISP